MPSGLHGSACILQASKSESVSAIPKFFLQFPSILPNFLLLVGPAFSGGPRRTLTYPSLPAAKGSSSLRYSARSYILQKDRVHPSPGVCRVETVPNLFLIALSILPLGSLIALILLRKRFTTLSLGDKVLLYSWLILFSWAFVGTALAILFHKTLFLLQGGVAVFSVILLIVATVMWLAYRFFRASLKKHESRTQ